MNKFHILSFVLAFIIGATTKTILEDLNDELVKQENDMNITFEEYAKLKDNQDQDPCDPFIPLVPDVSKLKTISEAKCKEYIWHSKNHADKYIKDIHCQIQKLYNHPTNNTKEVEDSYLADLPIIYGGRDAEVAEFPHMGAIGWRSSKPDKEWVFKCGSSLISEKFLLTAAHCTKLSPRFVSDIVHGDPEVVMLGVENIADTVGTKTRRPQIVKIKNIIVHPEYKAPKKYNDIALIELDTAVEFTPFISPACIWPHADIEPNETTISITGWGTTESGTPSATLQAAEVDFLDSKLCDDLLKQSRNRNWHGFTDQQMCAGILEGGVDTCQGDSGGPLQVRLDTFAANAMHLVVGITSFGIRCGVSNQPGVYTRVASYVDWIGEHVWNVTRA